MAQVYGAGGKTPPKKGRLGTGSYYPGGTPIFLRKGNVFPGIQPITSDADAAHLNFGDLSRAGISSRGDNGGTRLFTPAMHPNKGQYNTATLPLAPAMVVASAVDKSNLQPVQPSVEALQMPHERNTNSASGTHKKPLPYRTVFGASKTMPTDSAFQNQPSAMYKHQSKPKPGYAIEAVKKSAGILTFARSENPLPVSGGIRAQTQQRRTPPASFISRGNHWYDPHNSFVAGVHSAANPRSSEPVGRWNIVKKGVV